jgi:outer membrane protein OmpA-like peptidoglycan-associated protein
MNNFQSLTRTALAAAALAAVAACSSVPTSNAMLDQARSDYRVAQADAQTQALASAELRQAGEALARAEAAQSSKQETPQINHLAYLARQRVALAQSTAERKTAEATITQASAERDRLRLAARTREADTATQNAAIATADAASSQRDSAASMRQADAAQRQAAASQRQADVSQRNANASQLQASDAESRARALEAQLRDLNAKKTDRGMVITLGDVLFDTGRAELKPGAERNVDRLSAFLKANPARKVLIEGYTDSVGSDTLNQALSERRADAVRAALQGMGVDRAQLATEGFGEARPVAGNGNAAGRQMNRRVEIVLSDDTGVIGKR